jgi:preprotein translocase subunit YajC
VFISNAYAQTAARRRSWPDGQPDDVRADHHHVRGHVLHDDPSAAEAPEGNEVDDGRAGQGRRSVTAGGVLGRVVKVNDAYVTIEVAAGTEIVVQKNAVTTLLPKGTLKSL